jgi:hypothetical protein
MSEADQDHRAIPGTGTVALGSFDQLFDFALGQMLTRSQLAVRTPGPFLPNRKLTPCHHLPRIKTF